MMSLLIGFRDELYALHYVQKAASSVSGTLIFKHPMRQFPKLYQAFFHGKDSWGMSFFNEGLHGTNKQAKLSQ